MLGGGASIVLRLFCMKPDKLKAVDNLYLRIDCPPLNNEYFRGDLGHKYSPLYI